MVKSLSPQISNLPKQMPRGRPFEKGSSGNPGGRPKRTAEEVELIEACRAKTGEALETILELMESSDNDRVRLAAAQFVIERGWGKAPERIELLAATLDISADDFDESPMGAYLRLIKGGRVEPKALEPAAPEQTNRAARLALLQENDGVRL